MVQEFYSLYIFNNIILALNMYIYPNAKIDTHLKIA
jgi:hypothetical protein